MGPVRRSWAWYQDRGLPREPGQLSAGGAAASPLREPAGAPGGTVSRRAGRGGRWRPSRALLIVAASILAVAIAGAAVLITVLRPSPVTAAAAVAAVQPDRLAGHMAGLPFAATDVPGGTSAFAPQLSASLTSLTSTSDNSPEASGLVAAVHAKFSGAGDIGVSYYVFDNLGDANSYFSSAPLFSGPYRPAGSFSAAGIGDLTKCGRATAPAQLTAWGCLTLSNYVVSYSWVIESGAVNGAGLESELALDAVRHLRSAAEKTPPASLPQPPGSLTASALFAKLDSAFPAALVPEGLGSLPKVSTILRPALPGLMGSNRRIAIDFQGTGPDYTFSYESIYVFDTAQHAQAWFSTNLEPEDPAGKTDTRTNHVPFPPSGFPSSQQAQCNTYSQPAVLGQPAAGLSVCYVVWGNVVVTGGTRMSATASNREPVAADSNMALTMARAALLRIGQAIAP